MKKEVSNRDSMLTGLDMKILNHLKDGKTTNINQIAKELKSTQSVVKENIIYLKNLNLIKWRKRSIKGVIRHQISINGNYETFIKEITKIFLGE